MEASSPPSADSARPIAYSYIRFSDAKQRRGDSLRRQLERSREYAEKHGLRLNEQTTIRDLGVSAYRGANRQTGALGAFLQAVNAGKIAPGSFLLVESMDRLSRERPMVALEPFIGLINADITVVTLIDEVVHSRASYDRDWTSLIVSLAKMAQANEESVKKSDRLSERWKEKRAKAAQGVIASGRCPGWLRKEGDTFVVIPERAAIVRRIFDEFVGGTGRGTIALRLNRDGIPPFGHGRAWHGGSVQKVTVNPAVIGHYVPHTVVRDIVTGPDGKPMAREKRIPAGDTIERYYPTILPQELYYRALSVAESRSVVPGNAGGRKGTVVSNLFSGIATCVLCRMPMLYKDRGKRSTIVMRCSGEALGTCKNGHRYPYKMLEGAVLDWVDELDLGDVRSDQISDVEGRIAALVAQRNRLSQNAQDLLDQFAGASRIAKDRVLRLEKEIEDVEIAIGALRRTLERLKGSVPASERKAQVAALRRRMAVATGSDLYVIRAALAQSLRDVVQRMIFHQGGKVHLVVKGALKHYIFDPAAGRVNPGFEADVVKLVVQPDGEAGADQQALFEFAASVQAAIEADAKPDRADQ